MPTINDLRVKCKKNYWGPMHKFYHEIGFYFTKPFVNTKVTPNQITIIWITIQLIGSVLLAFGTYKHMLLGIIVYHFGFFVDCIDGNLARFRDTSTWTGIYLEQIAHYITITGLLIGLTIGNYLIFHSDILLIIGIGGTLSFVFDKMFGINMFHFSAHADQSNKEFNEDVSKAIKGSSLKNKSKFVVNIFGFLRVEHPLNLLFFLLLLGLPHVALILYSLMFFMEMLRKLKNNLSNLRRIDHKKALKYREV